MSQNALDECISIILEINHSKLSKGKCEINFWKNLSIRNATAEEVLSFTNVQCTKKY